jgi:hypothetical protein
VTLVLGEGELGPAAVLAGLGSTLIVLALGIIVNGARGKRPGGAQGLAIIVLIPLLVAALLPHSPNISYTEDATFAPKSDGGWTDDVYVVAFADATVDLRDFYTRPAATGSGSQVTNNVVLLVGNGNVTVLLPDDETVRYEAFTGTGSISGVTTEFGTNRGALTRDSGMWNSPDGSMPDSTDTDPTGADPMIDPPARIIDLDIMVGSGNVRFEAAASPSEGSNR